MGIGEADIVEDDFSNQVLIRTVYKGHGWLSIQHFVDPFDGDRRTRSLHSHKAGHDNGKHNLHEVAHKGGKAPNHLNIILDHA